MQVVPRPGQPPRLRAPARPRVAALLAVALILATSLSGCLSVDFFLPHKEADETGPSGDGQVRLWLAVQPGAIGGEFVHYNLTFGPSNHMHNIFGDHLVPMQSTYATVDLVAMERHGKAALLGSIWVPEGSYYGFTFQVTNASLAKSTVIGNDGGNEVVSVDEFPIANVTTPGLLMVDHVAFAESVTDLYLEIDMPGSLEDDKGTFSHATKVIGVSIYVNGHKAGRIDYDGIDRGGRGTDPYGSRWLDPSKYPDPVAHYEAEDARTGEEIYDSFKTNRRHDKVIGLGQSLDFVSRSYSRILEKGERVELAAWDWNFGDGTGASGPRASKNWTGGGVFDVSLTVHDSFGLVGRTFGSFVVPYRADEAVTTHRDARAGTIHIGSGTVEGAGFLSTASERLVFPEDLENGDLYIGGYRVTLRFADPSGGIAGPATVMRMHVKSGTLDETFNGTSPLAIETAGLPFWRGPLQPWVDEAIDVDLELVSGAEVSYELVVEALYYQNATRGLDGHAAHRHGTWNALGPEFHMIEWDGTARPLDEEEP